MFSDAFLSLIGEMKGGYYRPGYSGISEQFNELILKLRKAEIPFEQRMNAADNFNIGYPSFDEIVCSVIYGPFTYGSRLGYLEIMGLLTPEELEEDDVVGWLTAEEVFERIKNHWEKIDN